jgi:hypothetical protein
LSVTGTEPHKGTIGCLSKEVSHERPQAQSHVGVLELALMGRKVLSGHRYEAMWRQQSPPQQGGESWVALTWGHMAALELIYLGRRGSERSWVRSHICESTRAHLNREADPEWLGHGTTWHYWTPPRKGGES